MVRSSLFRSFSVAALAVALIGFVAAPASAQLTSVISGKVIDEADKPVEGAIVKGEFLGDVSREWTVKTDKNGGFLKAGLPPGPWKVTAEKDGKVGVNPRVELSLERALLNPIKLGDAKKSAAAGMSQKDVEANNKKQEAMATDFAAAKAAFDSGDFDGAIANLNKVIVNAPTCAACYLSVGDAQMKKNDTAAAEASYLKSIEIDPSKPEAYNALSSIYNSQKKFEEAGKMSAKASELSAGAGGGGDAQSTYNQGVILWNQSKAAEAEVQFKKATTLDPKMADAFYWLGMCRVNQGKLPDAKEPFTEYVKLAPTGQYAEQVKQMLAVIK